MCVCVYLLRTHPFTRQNRKASIMVTKGVGLPFRKKGKMSVLRGVGNV